MSMFFCNSYFSPVSQPNTDHGPNTDYFRCFPVLRIVRLVRISATLETFIAKIFGPAKKMLLLLVGSLSIILSMAMVSLQPGLENAIKQGYNQTKLIPYKIKFSTKQKLFAPKKCDPLAEEIKRNHFCDFPRSAMAMFQDFGFNNKVQRNDFEKYYHMLNHQRF